MRAAAEQSPRQPASGSAATVESPSTAESTAAVRPADKVKLLLNWYPEAEHGGYYAALVRGYYREAGLDVEILAGVPNTPVIQEVAREQVTFGVDNADKVLLARAQQRPSWR